MKKNEPRHITRKDITYRIQGSFGCFAVYANGRCLAFGIMTANDAENWIWANS